MRIILAVVMIAGMSSAQTITDQDARKIADQVAQQQQAESARAEQQRINDANAHQVGQAAGVGMRKLLARHHKQSKQQFCAEHPGKDRDAFCGR